MSRETTECHVGPWNGERVLSKNTWKLTNCGLGFSVMTSKFMCHLDWPRAPRVHAILHVSRSVSR